MGNLELPEADYLKGHETHLWRLSASPRFGVGHVWTKTTRGRGCHLNRVSFVINHTDSSGFLRCHGLKKLGLKARGIISNARSSWPSPWRLAQAPLPESQSSTMHSLGWMEYSVHGLLGLIPVLHPSTTIVIGRLFLDMFHATGREIQLPSHL